MFALRYPDPKMTVLIHVKHERKNITENYSSLQMIRRLCVGVHITWISPTRDYPIQGYPYL